MFILIINAFVDYKKIAKQIANRRFVSPKSRPPLLYYKLACDLVLGPNNILNFVCVAMFCFDLSIIIISYLIII